MIEAEIIRSCMLPENPAEGSGFPTSVVSVSLMAAASRAEDPAMRVSSVNSSAPPATATRATSCGVRASTVSATSGFCRSRLQAENAGADAAHQELSSRRSVSERRKRRA